MALLYEQCDKLEAGIPLLEIVPGNEEIGDDAEPIDDGVEDAEFTADTATELMVMISGAMHKTHYTNRC